MPHVLSFVTRRLSNSSVVAALVVAAIAAPAQTMASPLTFQASGATAADIQASVDAFRAALGANNGNGGTFDTGRREINWDGVPDIRSSPNAMPADQFKAGRGATFSTPGSGFQVSASLASGVPVEFENLEPGLGAEFSTFSPQRLFTAIDSTITDVTFTLPGTDTAAVVRGFGAVFTGVEVADATRIDLYGIDDALIDSVFAPVRGAGGLSFAAFFADDARIARVRLHSGTVALGSPDGGDRVAMDDFIYGEPTAADVPEPTMLSLLALGAAIATALRRS